MVNEKAVRKGYAKMSVEDRNIIFTILVDMYREELIDCINLETDEKEGTERDRTSNGNTVARCPLSRRWFCTFWVEDISVQILLSIFKKNNMSGAICSEYCEDGKEHIHLYVIFPERVRFTEYMNRFGYKKFKSFVSGKNGTKRALEYIRKEGNYQTWGKDLEFPLYKVGQNVLPLKNL